MCHRGRRNRHPLSLQWPVMDSELLVPVEIPLIGDERRKNWAKIVLAVDDTKSSGWAFEGDFIAVGGVQDVPVDAVILVYGERGSRTNPQVEVRVMRANPDGTLTFRTEAKGRAWARTIRDDVVTLLEETSDEPVSRRQWDAGLLGYSEDALIAELERRGLDVDVKVHRAVAGT